MSTDSTELTFVRCPSCRSLVPAVSTRCRMCGAALESSESMEQTGTEEDGSSRVRQRTISKPKSDLNSAVKRLREELEQDDPEASAAAEAPVADQAAAQPAAGDEGFEDPLSGYIEEVDDGTSGAGSSAPAAQAKGDTGRSDAPPAETTKEPEARVIVETGGRRGGRPGLSFARGGDEDRSRERKQTSDQPQAQEERQSQRKDDQQRGRDRRDRDGGERQRDARDERGRDRNRDRDRQQGRDQRQEQSRPEPQAQESSGPARVKQEGMKGRLAGWLVSYASSEGDAYELREGKFFVSGSKLKPTDLVLEDPSVSVPHALVSVHAEKGLTVQDLMSDRGIFLRTKDGDTYQREEEMIHARHGDWIRFGDVEFLVCLIAHVGVK